VPLSGGARWFAALRCYAEKFALSLSTHAYESNRRTAHISRHCTRPQNRSSDTILSTARHLFTRGVVDFAASYLRHKASRVSVCYFPEKHVDSSLEVVFSLISARVYQSMGICYRAVSTTCNMTNMAASQSVATHEARTWTPGTPTARCTLK
jgi:hypothetical protein